MERVRCELGLGINQFLRLAGIAKATYYRRKRGGKVRACPAQTRIAEMVQVATEQHPPYGYRKVWAVLTRQGLLGSPSTVYRWMKHHERLQKSHRRKGQRYTPPPRLERIGLTVGLDLTHWGRARVCNVIEYQSRYCLAAVAGFSENAPAAITALDRAMNQAQALKLPARSIRVKSDQGTPFTSDAFGEFLRINQCGQTLSPVGRPEGMGRVERFHRSLKEECLQYEDIESLEELNAVLESFRKHYSHSIRFAIHQAFNTCFVC